MVREKDTKHVPSHVLEKEREKDSSCSHQEICYLVLELPVHFSQMTLLRIQSDIMVRRIDFVCA
jgi:hypothetical protein